MAGNIGRPVPRSVSAAPTPTPQDRGPRGSCVVTPPRLREHAGTSGGEPALGQWYDADSGLHYNFFRYYDPDVGRFLSPDPIDLLGGLNLYLAVSDPLSQRDRFGLVCEPTMPEPATPPTVLVSRGSQRESAKRLAQQAAAADKAGNAKNGIPYGHGVSVTTPEANARLSRDPTDASQATRAAFEAVGFEVRATPTNSDPTHHTVQLSNPVTPEVAAAFNAVLGRTT